MSIAQGLVDILQEEMQKVGAKSLLSVKLQIGKLSMIVPHALEFCFNILVEDTNMKGAHLEFEEIPLKGLCKDCGNTFESQDHVFECPFCNGPNIEITDGQGIYILEMEVQ